MRYREPEKICMYNRGNSCISVYVVAEAQTGASSSRFFRKIYIVRSLLADRDTVHLI